jgi:hypothetical protein
VPDISNSSESQHWRELYRDCVLELDSVKLSQRIAEAESIIARRSAELLSDGGDHFQEQRDLSDAKYGLHALRNMLKQPNAIATTDLHRKVG